MMTWAWTLQWVLLNPARKPDLSDNTGRYIKALVLQLTPWEYNYSELMWRFLGELPDPEDLISL